MNQGNVGHTLRSLLRSDSEVKMIKSVTDIRDEFFDEGKLSDQSIKDLIWHIGNDPSPDRSITLVTDARLMSLVPLIAKYLDHEDDFIRERTGDVS